MESGFPVSFKMELLRGIHDFNNDVFKMALYTDAAELTVAGTTAYTTAGEVVGTGYTAGGVTLTGADVASDGTVAVVDFDDVSFSDAVFTYRGALIYNSSKSNRAVRIIDFGPSDGPETNPVIRFPTPGAQTAVIRM